MTEASLYLTDGNGTLYLAEPEGAFDPPAGEDEVGAYYFEDEDRPEGVVPLYRLTVQES